ncbi:DUF4430 domain-containing protein [Halobacillus salinarum]|uniref:DUF4430 domain-containing protein n=1 Tax=Halobacillus salinarum TaxID=2932257 RepID=A0ABY4EDY5_9BACI|nr:DUF4430 domain-containing protein [Halobacillus salinarum]UOQ42668.1 DUF4430 domain-containing protein [Halobacillus salinarum]
MKKLYSLFLAAILTAGVLAGCQSQDEAEQAGSSTEEKQEVSVHVTISTNNGEKELADKELSVEEGKTLMEMMKNKFEVKESDGYITGIEGVTADESKKQAWMYTVNGEEATVGASEYELKSGDEVVFDMHKWE